MKLDGADIVTVDRPTAATCLEVACRRNVADVGLETGREEFPPCDRPFQVWNVPEKQVGSSFRDSSLGNLVLVRVHEKCVLVLVLHSCACTCLCVLV